MAQQKRLYAIINAPPTASDLFRGCICLVLGIILGLAHSRLGAFSVTGNARGINLGGSSVAAVVVPPIAAAFGWGKVLGPAAVGCGALAAAFFMTPLLGWSEPAWVLGGVFFGIGGTVLRRQMRESYNEKSANPLGWKAAGGSIVVGLMGGALLAAVVASSLLVRGRYTYKTESLPLEDLEEALFLGPGIALLAALALFCVTVTHRLGGYALAMTYLALTALLVREEIDRINPTGFVTLTIPMIAATAVLHAEDAHDPPVMRIDVRST